MPKTLITGGAGFLGSHLCDYLLDQGHEVYCVDNFCTSSIKNIAHIKNQRFHFIESDVSEKIPVTEPLDFVLHLASPASPDDFDRLQIETLKAGSLGTLNSLEIARQNGATFLLASSSEIYGEPLEHPQKESYWGNVNPVGSRSIYNEAKRFAEAMTTAYKRKFKLQTRIARIFNTYGPRMRLDDGRIIPNLLSQAIQGKKLTIYGDGTQTRTFCYVSDMIEGLYKLLISNIDRPINIGSPIELSIVEVAKKIKALTHCTSEIIFKRPRENDPKNRQPDITLAQSMLNWYPKINLDDGLRKTLQFLTQEIF